MENVVVGAAGGTSILIKRVAALALQSQRVIQMVMKTVNGKSCQFQRVQESAHQKLKLQVVTCREIRRWNLASRRSQKALRMVPGSFRTSLGNKNYCIVERSSLYDDQVEKLVTKWASRWQVQMKVQLFDPVDFILIIGFLHRFKLAGDSNRIYERAAIRLLFHFKRESAAAALTAHLSLKEKLGVRASKKEYWQRVVTV